MVGSEGPSPTVPLSSTHMNDARVKSELLSMFILIKSDTLHNSHKSRVSASPISSFSPTQGRVRLRTSFMALILGIYRLATLPHYTLSQIFVFFPSYFLKIEENMRDITHLEENLRIESNYNRN